MLASLLTVLAIVSSDATAFGTKEGAVAGLEDLTAPAAPAAPALEMMKQLRNLPFFRQIEDEMERRQSKELFMREEAEIIFRKAALNTLGYDPLPGGSVSLYGQDRLKNLLQKEQPENQCLLSVGICGWQGYRTFRNTLNSYRDYGLLEVATQKYVFWQHLKEKAPGIGTKTEISRLYDLEVYGSQCNGGFTCIADVLEQAKCRYLLFLEEDFELIASKQVVIAHLMHAMALLLNSEKKPESEHGPIKAVRMRSRYKPGYPNWSHNNYKASFGLQQSHLLQATNFASDPVATSGGKIWACNSGSEEFWCAPASGASYTLNALMFDADWFRGAVMPQVRLYKKEEHGQVEEWINKVLWSKLNITVAAGSGLFFHNRLDRDGWVAGNATGGDKTQECQ
jgi:hypothetical protein